MHRWALHARTPSCHLFSHVREVIHMENISTSHCVILKALKGKDIKPSCQYKSQRSHFCFQGQSKMLQEERNSSKGVKADDKSKINPFNLSAYVLWFFKINLSFLPPGLSWRRCHPSRRSLRCWRARWRRGPCQTLSNLWLMWRWLKAKRCCWNARWRACPTQASAGTTTGSALRAAKNAKWPSVSKEPDNKQS